MATTETLPNVFQRWPRRMGKVLADITIENAYDRIRIRDGTLSPAASTSLDLGSVLVDTGASHLFLPAADITRLRLELKDEVDVETANGMATTQVYEGARVTIGERSGIFECVALPRATAPLLGCQVLEGLGIIPDVVEQRLIFLPQRGRQSWITAYRA